MKIKAVIQVPESFRNKAAFALKTLLSVCCYQSELLFLDIDSQHVPDAHIFYGLKRNLQENPNIIQITTSKEAIDYFELKHSHIPSDITWNSIGEKNIPILFHDSSSEIKNSLNDVVASAFFFLSDWQSHLAGSRDEHGRRIFEDSFQSIFTINDVPIVDYYAKMVANELEKKGYIFKKHSLWNNRPFGAVITHDFDRIKKRTFGSFIREFIEVPFLNKINLSPKDRVNRFKKSFSSLLSFDDGYQNSIRKVFKLHEQLNIKPTVLLKSISKKHTNDARDYLQDPFMAEIISNIGLLNGEIGLHSSYEAGYDASLFQRERAQLENRIKMNVVSHRHHYLRYNEIKGLDVAINSGILVDSTLGWAHSTGYRTGTTFPHFTYDLNKNTTSPLLELPLMLMDMQFSKYMGMSTSDGFHFAKRQVDEAVSTGGLVVWNFHHHIYDNAEFPEGAFLLENSLNYLTKKQPLFLTMSEVYDHYKSLQS